MNGVSLHKFDPPHPCLSLWEEMKVRGETGQQDAEHVPLRFRGETQWYPNLNQT
jgi:hypothetical protein